LFDLRTYLFQLCGVGLTCIDVTTAFKVLAEVGADLSRFKSTKHFASWLGLCPGHQDIRRQGLVRGVQAYHQPRRASPEDGGGQPVHQPIGPGRLLPPAVRRDGPAPRHTACAHKLAWLIYTSLTKGEEYVDQGQAQYEERYCQRMIRNLTRKAEKLGFQLVPAPEAD
jgi:transposase